MNRAELGSPVTSEESSFHSAFLPSFEKINWASSGSIESEISSTSRSMENRGESLDLSSYGEYLPFSNKNASTLLGTSSETKNIFGGEEFLTCNGANKTVVRNSNMPRSREYNELFDYQSQSQSQTQPLKSSPPLGSQNQGNIARSNSAERDFAFQDNQCVQYNASHGSGRGGMLDPRQIQQDRFVPNMDYPMHHQHQQQPVSQHMAIMGGPLGRNLQAGTDFRNGGTGAFRGNYPQHQILAQSQHLPQHQMNSFRPNMPQHGGMLHGGAGIYANDAYNNMGMNNAGGGGAVYVVQHKNAFRHYMLHPQAPRQVTVGDFVIVDGDRGEDLGVVTDLLDMNAFIQHKLQMAARGGAPDEQENTVGQILRIATLYERQQLPAKYHDEQMVVKYCSEIVGSMYMIPMVVLDAEFQFDRHKLTIFYDAGRARIDFRELVRDLYSTYKTRIWMKQVDTEGLRPFYPKQFATMALATGVQFNTEKF